MKRSKFNMGHYNLLSAAMGKLVPTSVVEVLPGDSMQQVTQALLRVSPLVAPVMHPVSVRFHTFYVPNRLVWETDKKAGTGWEFFITGGKDGTDAQTPPVATAQTVEEGSPADYMGIPPGANREYIKMAMLSYAMIYNEYYRDEDLATEADLDTYTGAQASDLFNIAWEKDYFTTSRPTPQKGPDVLLPLGDKAYVGADLNAAQTVTAFSNEGPNALLDPQLTNLQIGAQAGSPTEAQRLYADLTNATAANVNDIRKAFAIQRYQEARMQYGSRFTEYLRYLGVTSSDARLQRPEYLGGGKQTISFSEVLGTYQGADATDIDRNLGQLGGHGMSAIRTRPFRRFFEEHGHVITLMSCRPKSIYSESQHRMYNRIDKLDYWQKELETIGQQEVKNREIYADHTTPDGTFGFQDRYSEYKHVPSRVSSQYRQFYNYWHMARSFGSDPALNQSFTDCVPTNRIYADQTNDPLLCMVNHNVRMRRLVRKTVRSRII